MPEIEMQIVDEDQEHASGGVVRRPRGREDDALLRGRGRRRLDVEHAAAVRQHERDDVLLDAVLEDLELVRLQIRDELIAFVADDHVGRDEVDADAECRLLPVAAGQQAAALRRRATGVPTCRWRRTSIKTSRAPEISAGLSA